MAKYILRRVMWLPVIVFLVASLTFLVLRMVPGNPVDAVAAQITDADELARLRAEWGFDQPLWRQYGTFMAGLARGDLGVSMSSGTPVSRLLMEKIPPTIELAAIAMGISTFVGIGVGILSGMAKSQFVSGSLQTLAILSISMPWFWIAIILVVVFSVNLGWTPVSGRIGAGIEYRTITNFMLIDHIVTGNGEALKSFLLHLTLPALAVGLTSAGFVARLMHSAMLEVIHADYIRTARAKGLDEGMVTFRHALRNAILPVITLQGLQFGTLLGGAVITEIVFSWPGVGRMLLDSIMRRDYAVVQGTVIVVAAAYVLVNLLVDITYHVIDPRLRHS